MAGEIQFETTSGVTCYAQIRSSTGTIWNTAGGAFEAYNAANWTDYDIAVVEQGTSGVYVGDVPVGVNTKQSLSITGFRRVGGSPAQGDPRVAAGDLPWSGTGVLLPPTVAEILAAGDVDGYTFEQFMKLCLAALAGKLSGAATTTVTIRAADDSKARITATVDSDGNRTAITLDATG